MSDISADATANYLFQRLNEAIGTIATQTGEIAQLKHDLSQATKPEDQMAKKKPKPKPAGQSAKQMTGKLKSRTGAC